MKESIKVLEKLITDNESITLISHFNPDGDAVGSTMGMKWFLNSLGKKCQPVLPNPIPKTIDYLDKDGEILYYTLDKEKVSNIISESKLIICLDFNKLYRTEWMEELIRNASATKVLIDHHIAPDAEEFDLVFSQPESSSTCELLFRILMNTSFIGGDAAKLPYNSRLSLATGLITDTNNFSNSLTPTTFETASKLLESGIDFNYITNMVQKRFSEDRIRLMGHLMSKSMITYKDLNAACTILTLEDKARYNFQDGDSEGFVNIPLSIDDVEVSGFFSDSKDGYVKVSLRSKNWFSSNRFSNQYFNGGGHEKAAGGRLFIPIEEVPEYFKKSLEQFLLNEKGQQ